MRLKNRTPPQVKTPGRACRGPFRRGAATPRKPRANPPRVGEQDGHDELSAVPIWVLAALRSLAVSRRMTRSMRSRSG